MTGARTISLPSANTLSVLRYDGTQVDFCLDTGVVKIRSGAPSVVPACSDSAFVPLTTPNVVVGTLEFTDLPGTPQGVVLTTDVGGVSFEMRKYIRG